MTDQPPSFDSTRERSEASWEMYKRRLFLAVGVVSFLLMFATFVSATVNILLLLFLSVLIAIGLCGLRNWLASHSPLSSRFALAVVVVVMLLLLVGAILLIGARVAEQFSELGTTLPAAQERLEAYLSRFAWGQQLAQEIPPVSQLGPQLFGGEDTFARITGVFSSTLSILSTALVTIFIALFLAIEPQAYVSSFLHLIPHARRERMRETLVNVNETLERWLLTRFFSMLLVGVLTGIGLTVIGIPLVLSLALIAAIGAFIPTFGPILALIPALLVALIQSPQQAIAVLAVYLGVQSVDNYLVSPLLQRSMLYLPPAYIVAMQLLFGVVAGPFGVVLAAPLAAALVVLVRNLYVVDVIGDKIEALHD